MPSSPTYTLYAVRQSLELIPVALIAPADVGQFVPTASVAGESEVLLMVMVADGGSTVF